MEKKLGNSARLPDYLGSGSQKPYQFLSDRQSVTAGSSKKKQERDKHERNRDVASPRSEDTDKAARGQHKGDIAENGTITELDTARDKRTST